MIRIIRSLALKGVSSRTTSQVLGVAVCAVTHRPVIVANKRPASRELASNPSGKWLLGLSRLTVIDLDQLCGER
jgi:hypothetical protein